MSSLSVLDDGAFVAAPVPDDEGTFVAFAESEGNIVLTALVSLIDAIYLLANLRETLKRRVFRARNELLHGAPWSRQGFDRFRLEIGLPHLVQEDSGTQSVTLLRVGDSSFDVDLSGLSLEGARSVLNGAIRTFGEHVVWLTTGAPGTDESAQSIVIDVVKGGDRTFLASGYTEAEAKVVLGAVVHVLNEYKKELEENGPFNDTCLLGVPIDLWTLDEWPGDGLPEGSERRITVRPDSEGGVEVDITGFSVWEATYVIGKTVISDMKGPELEVRVMSEGHIMWTEPMYEPLYVEDGTSAAA